jgi:hypothetical protein
MIECQSKLAKKPSEHKTLTTKASTKVSTTALLTKLSIKLRRRAVAEGNPIR